MTQDEVIKSMGRIKDWLVKWTEKPFKLIDSICAGQKLPIPFTDTLGIGLLDKLDGDCVWLEVNYPNFAGPLRRKYDEIRDLGEKMDQLTKNGAVPNEIISYLTLFNEGIIRLINTLDITIDKLAKEPKKDLDAGIPTDGEKVKTQTRAKNNWKPPKGYTGSQAIIHSTVGELKEHLNLPTQGDGRYKIPRSTLEFRRKRDEATGGELEGKIKKDPRTHEVYYPKKWLKKQIMNYKPRVRKP